LDPKIDFCVDGDEYWGFTKTVSPKISVATAPPLKDRDVRKKKMCVLYGE
jgi:hypothetical protein